jgi:hypothetical protein
MRRLVLVALLALVFVAATTPTQIRPDALIEHIRFLASDQMKGRANGSEELNRAAEYVAQQFKTTSLKPGGEQDSWFQPFELVAGLNIGADNRLSIESRGIHVQLMLGKSYYPLAAPSNDNASVASSELKDTPVVFAGYGLSVPDLGYDDYRRLDVAGKAVLIFSHEPQELDPNSKLNGTRPMPQTTLQAKASLARSKGARILLVVSDPSHRVDQADYGLFTKDPDADDEGIPVLRLRRTEMQPLIDAWKLDAAAKLIDDDLVPRSQPLSGVEVNYTEHLTKNRRMVSNVIGVLTGNDPAKAKEAVVIGAHYDHVGLGGHLSVSPERVGEIHNGADDNASGTASIMEIARAASQQRSRFPRSLVFIAFAGEERGLLGSAYYVAHPTISIGETIAMLNLDMVGRARGGVDVSGIEASPSMEADLKAATMAVGELEIRRQGPGAGRSDDSSFIDRRIPAINFFTGFHGDYHRPTDDWERIDVPGTTQVATLALELAAHLAARRDRPEFVQR